MRESRVLYVGKILKDDNSISYSYRELDNNNEIVECWNFKKKIFIKGSVGSVYACKFKENSISYNKREIPTSLVKDDANNYVSTFIKYPFLEKFNEETRQIDIRIRNSKKRDSLVDTETENLKKLYNSLPSQKRAAFIGNLIYKLTKA